MSWRDRLQCAGPIRTDRSDTSLTSVTSVTASSDPQNVAMAIEDPARAAPISRKAPQFRELEQPNDDDSTMALREIAALLAAAYRRQQELRRVPEDHPSAGAQHGLALSGQASVHGVVT